jgi:hypothetical protein
VTLFASCRHSVEADTPAVVPAFSSSTGWGTNDSRHPSAGSAGQCSPTSPNVCYTLAS